MNRFSACLVGMTLGASLIRAELPKTSADLFRLDRIWNATLTLGASDWEHLQPNEPQRGGPGGPGGFRGPGGPGGFRGPGGPGGGPGGPPAFGPGNFLAGGFLNQLDQDKDGSVSQSEFQAGFAQWFTAWDAQKKGALSQEDFREGLNKLLMTPPPGGRPGGPGGPGGPGLQASEGRRNGMSGAGGIHFEYVHATLNFEGVPLQDVALRYKGNGTYMDARGSDKKSLKVDLNEFVKGQKLGGVTKLNFHNNVTDVAWMHEPLAYELYRAAGVPAPRTSYARVTLNAAGARTNQFLGLYSLVENPDSNWAEQNFGSRKGAIFKPVTRELFKFQGTDWSKYKQAYDAKTDLTAKQQQRVYDFAKLITDADDGELARRLPEFLDIDEFSRFMAVTVWLSSTDSILLLGQNFVVYLHPKTDKFQFVPWDLDRAFGNFFTPSPEQLSIRKAWTEENRFLSRVMAVPAVKEAYLARIREFQDTLFQPARFGKLVDEVAQRIRPVVKDEDPKKLKAFDQAVAGILPDAGGPAGPGGPGDRGPGRGDRGPGGPGPFRMNAKPIKLFVKERHQFVADQLAGKSEGLPLGGGGPGGRGPGGPGGFGPGNFVGPVFFKAADADSDGKVTQQELTQLAERWFREWDKAKSGKLKQEDLASGLNAVVPPPDFGRPPQ